MKKIKALTLVAMMLVPVLANAQWVHDATYSAHLDSISSVHGIAVDGEGKVWVQPYYASETIVMNRDVGADGIPDTLSTRVLYIYNADGSEASFSPLYVLNYADGSADTLGRVWYPDETDSVDGGSYEGYSGRGITAGEEAVVTIDGSFSRDMQVSADGNTIWWAGYTNGSVFRYSREDEFSSFGAPDTVLVGMKSEVFDIHPVTGHLWAGSGSLNDVPASPWTPQTWYAFDVSTIGTENEIPVDSIRWAATTDDGSTFDAARPRGLDFSADGMTAYISTFSAANSVQKHMKSDGNSNEVVNQLPNGYALDQNYPNPFNPTTNINYSLQNAGHVTLKVYDMTGREIATLINGRMNAGAHTVTFNASNLSSGVYIYALEANGVRLTNRMTLIK